MNDNDKSSVHWSFWIIGGAALVWNVMGGINFLVQLSPDAIASFPESARAIIEGRPMWATAGFAISVFGGTLACLLLLFGKSAAYYYFIGSLLGTIVTMIHTINIANSSIGFSAVQVVMMILMPLVVAAFLIWYSKQAENRAWIS